MGSRDEDDSAAKLATLKQQRSTARKNITRIKNLLDNTSTTWNVIDLECRLEILSSYIKQIMAYQTEIEKEDPSDDRRGDIEESCISAKTKLLQLLGQHKRRESSALETTFGITMPQASRLPKLKLPTFSGKYSEYKNFISSFNNLVHNEAHLAPIEKFNHLLSCLSGDALRTVKAFQVTEANYEKSLERLADRYDKKGLIFFDNIEQLFEIEKINKPNAPALRNAVDTVSAIYDSLLSMGSEKDIANALIISLVISKVDSVTKSKWNEQLDYSTLPTWSECSKHLIRRCQALEVNEDHSNKNLFEKKKNSKASFSNNNNKTSYTVTRSNNEGKCTFCHTNGHSVYNCNSFAALPITKRFEFIKKEGSCINCLKTGHSVRSCSKAHCRVCQRPHHTLLHRYAVNTQQGNSSAFNSNSTEHPSSSSTTTNSLNHRSSHHVSSNADIVVLATALVKIKDRSGNDHLVRALLDSGSQLNFISEECAANLQLKREFKNLKLSGIGELNTNLRHQVNTTVKSRLNNYNFQTDFWVIKSISSYQPEVNLQFSTWQVPKNIELADPQFNKRQRVDLLIGADIFFELLSAGQIKLNESLPTLQKTRLGWMVSGRYKQGKGIETGACNIPNEITDASLVSLDETVRKFWEIEESPGVERNTRKEYTDCENHFVENMQLLPKGRFQVRLPFKRDPSELGSSYDVAKRRYLSLERRLAKTPDTKKMYDEFMLEYLSLGHMTEVKNIIPSSPHYFIPHQVVMRLQSLTTKLRVVFDASAKTSTHKSLNKMLMVGPTIQPELYITLLKFRCRKFAITADITKMYRQVEVHEEDRKFQMILWRETVNMPIKVYELNTVTYGTSPAPFLAIRCLDELGQMNRLNMPVGSRVIQEDFYVDDLLSGGETLEEIMQIQTEVVKILASAGFKLAKWYSNHDFLESNSISEKTITLNDTETTKTLGIIWHPKLDEFRFSCSNDFNNLRPTKRNILSVSSRLFDPLGLLCPIITKAKMILQELWLHKLEWDESIPMSLATSWDSFKENIRRIPEIRIPRFINMLSSSKIQVHGFADASMRAYGCCIYIRSGSKNNYKSILLTAKSKVAPLKTKTLPRLELCAVHLLAKLWKNIAPILLPNTEKTVFWTDSEIVLYWLKKHPSTLSVFVGNRVADVQEWTEDVIWKHVPTAHNPADIASRSCTEDEMRQSIWFNGPRFLTQDEDNWPNNPHFKPPEDMENLEIRKTKPLVLLSSKKSCIIHTLIENCSTYLKIVRILAYVYRFFSPTEKEPQITAKELEMSFLKIIEVIQYEEFENEIKCLINSSSVNKQIQKLNPFVQEYNEGNRKFTLLRVGGRLQNPSLPYDTKHPLLIPKCRFAYLYATHLHLTNCHAGPRALIALMRLKIWSVNAREIARKVVRNCTHCFKYKPKLLTQVMGNLPMDRLLSVRPFWVTGVDFCGPIYTSYRIRGRPPYKTYIAVFVCFSSKAVHIEAVSDLTTNSFISCFKRFIGRRGLPHKVVCDNATNFVGANAKMKELHDVFFNEVSRKQMLDFVAEKGVQFEFIPPRAPHFGGLWEAAVKSTKNLLYRTVANANLTFEELCTVLVEVEAVLNSRPIAPMSTDPSDGEALTPAHLLIGCSLKAIPEPTVETENMTYSKRWQRIAYLKGQFWSAFRRDYLLELQARAKWVKPEINIEIGTMVLVHEDNMPPQRWLMGKVTSVVAGKDGMVRVAHIKTRNGVIKRAVHKLAPLPLN